MSDKQVLKIVDQLRTAYRLKRTLRYRTTRDHSIHSESVAEHIFALFFLAEYFLLVEKGARSLNKEKLYQILLFHDFGEIIHGDVPTMEKKDFHRIREAKAAKKVFASLPQPFGNYAYKGWEDYERQKSPEARFANALDKVEPLFELMDPVNEQSLKRMKTTYESHMPKKLKATENFPVMRKFLEITARDMQRRKVFWTG